MPEYSAEFVLRAQRAVWMSNFRFLIVMVVLFLAGHLHEIANQEDTWTFWILSGLWTVIVFYSNSLLNWVLDPFHALKAKQET